MMQAARTLTNLASTRMVCAAVLLALFSAPLTASQFGLDDRAKWKSFGGPVGLTHDPYERARAARNPVTITELRNFRSLDGSDVGRLKSLIALAEAGPRGYDAYHVGASRPPPKRPTQMTLGEVRSWVKRTPGQPHAIGRYQFIPNTFDALVRRAGFRSTTRFTPDVQDKMADLLLKDAGFTKFKHGKISMTRFMNNLAKVWAGLPESSGRSAYHGYAGNKATISWAFYKDNMTAIFR